MNKKRINIYKQYNQVLTWLFNLIVFFLLIALYNQISVIYLLGLLILLVLIHYSQLFNYKKSVDNTFVELDKYIDVFIERKELDGIYEETALSLLAHKLNQFTRLRNKEVEEFKDGKKEVESLISDISHQTKTPISNIVLFSELLKEYSKENSDDETNIQYLDIIEEQTHKLKWLVQSLVQASRLEQGIIKCDKKRNNLTEIVNMALREIEALSMKENINITFSNDSCFYAEIDAKWTKEAIINILDNSIKYSNKNDISISIEERELFHKISIVDKGIGIKENEITSIFTRFYRGSNTDSYSGVGIGLYLAKEIILVQGGYIKVESTLGKGSSFHIYIRK